MNFSVKSILSSVFLLTYLICFSSSPVGAQTNFQYNVIDSNCLPTIWAKGNADFNGDGFTDIVIGGLGTVVWYENPGCASGIWKKHTICNITNVGFEGCATGDIDNDGDIDIIVGGHYTHVVYCLENPGNEQDIWILHNLGGPMTDSSYLFDLDGDGKLELITRASELWSSGVGRDIYIWQQGNNPFDHTQWKRHRKYIGTGEHFNIGDVDQDGKTDILFANKWLKNNARLV